ncbi:MULTISPECIES: hypothetical protein [Acidianus]|uniref:Uncharacterized protein n=1 Tax=Candidatus Acidianus copahuensis TaxID=1160895 RepID=A0A031LNC1_9CREN|nr:MULTISPECIES: hypothetical protein [Acidianus]EZQ04910.1 hypothetical protein CM19_08035 [Candidatus Acidianus copahuensis]NON61192.1 hypothetical protein [Acidianus sp. RZ1]
MSEVVSVRLKRDIVKEVDDLVKLGLFSSRNEALNFLISQGLKEVDYLKEELEKAKKVSIPKIDKTLEDFLGERERF